MPDRRFVVNQNLEGYAARIIRRLTLDIVANMQENPPEGTPVKTGFHRSNWIPNIGAPFPAAVGSPEAVDQGQAASAGARVAATYTIEAGPVFVTNNAVAIQRLNDGHSKQTPKGFVQRGIAKAVRFLRLPQ